jgi:hypothetical protein
MSNREVVIKIGEEFNEIFETLKSIAIIIDAMDKSITQAKLVGDLKLICRQIEKLSETVLGEV